VHLKNVLLVSVAHGISCLLLGLLGFCFFGRVFDIRGFLGLKKKSRFYSKTCLKIDIYLKFSKFQLVLIEVSKFLNYQISDVNKLSKLNLLSKMHLNNRLPTYMDFWKENLLTLVFMAFLV
jgi:hypothetical protein